MAPTKTLLRIVPPPMGEDAFAHRTMGTQVLTPDGTPLPGVTRITLTAEPNSIWRATIECTVEAPEICALTGLRTYKPMGRFKRLVLRLIGVRVAEVTNLGSTEREFEAV